MVSGADEQGQTALLTPGMEGSGRRGGNKSTMEEGDSLSESHLMSPGSKQLGFPTSQQMTPGQFSGNGSHKVLPFVPIPRTIICLKCNSATGCSA